MYHRVARIAAGAGFLISPHLVLTAAHVVDGVADEDLNVAFPLSTSTDPVEAEVLFVGGAGADQGDDVEHVAVLRLAQPRQLEPEAPLAAIGVGTGRLNVIGFPDGHSLFEVTEVEVSFETNDLTELRPLPGRPRLRPGYSGGMVFADPEPMTTVGRSTTLLVGMVVTADAETGIGRMLPVPRLCRLWSTLPQLVRLVGFKAWDYIPLRQLMVEIDFADARRAYRLLARGCTVPLALPSWVDDSTSLLDFLVTCTAPARLHYNLRLYLTILIGTSRSEKLRSGPSAWMDEHLPEDTTAALDGDEHDVIVVRIKESGEGQDKFLVSVGRAGADGDDPAEPVTKARAELPGYVVEQLEPVLKETADHAMVEFIMPASWLDEAVDEWPMPQRDSDEDPVPLGWLRPVVVRDRDHVDQNWTPDKRLTAQRRWDALMARSATEALRWYGCEHSGSATRLLLKWLLMDRPGAVALTRPAGRKLARPAQQTGLPIAAWPRIGCDHDGDAAAGALCPGADFRRRLNEDLAGVALAELPAKVCRLRMDADDETNDGYGRMALYWENPYRHRDPPPSLGLGE